MGLAPGSQGPGPSRPAAARSARVQPADVREAPRPRAPSSLGAARSVPTEGSRYFQMFEAAWGTSFPDAQTLNWAGAGEGASPPPASGSLSRAPGPRSWSGPRWVRELCAWVPGTLPGPSPVPPTPRSLRPRALTKTTPTTTQSPRSSCKRPPRPGLAAWRGPGPAVALWPGPPSRPRLPPSLRAGAHPAFLSWGRGQQGGPSPLVLEWPPAPFVPGCRPPAGGTMALLWTLLGASPPCPPAPAWQPAAGAEWASVSLLLAPTPAHLGWWVWVLAGTNTMGPEITENANLSHLLLQVQSRSNADPHGLPAAGLPCPRQPCPACSSGL